MNKKKKLIIFGLEDFANIAYEYFTFDSHYDVVGFTVNKKYIRAYKHLNLPVYPFEDIENKFNPKNFEIFIAIVYGNLNETRESVYQQCRSKGFKLASYISSKSFVWKNVKYGQNCFIFEDNTIQPYVKIGNNVVLWSGNHIGHHTSIEDNVFVSSHVVISGNCKIGKNCFIGVNSTLANETSIGSHCWISHGSILNGEMPNNCVTIANKSEVKQLNKKALFKVLNSISNKRNPK